MNRIIAGIRQVFHSIYGGCTKEVAASKYKYEMEYDTMNNLALDYIIRMYNSDRQDD